MKAKIALKVDWRLSWYSVMIWLLAVVVTGLVILPWFYLALPIVLLATTIVYFKKTDKTLAMGIWVSLIWFLVVATLDFLEIVGPNFGNLTIYFSDFRNWLKFPLILLIPVIYSMVLENENAQKPLRNRPGIV